MADRRADSRATLLVTVFALISAFAFGWLLGGRRCVQETPSQDTVYVHTADTVTLIEARVDTLVQYTDVLVTVRDTVRVRDTLYVSMPYESRHYSQPDTLDVWYSGIYPRIDSARVYMHTVTKTIREPYETAKMPLITLDLGIAGIYAQRRVNPYLFAEMRYNAKKTTFSAFGAIDHEGGWGIGAAVAYRLVETQ